MKRSEFMLGAVIVVALTVVSGAIQGYKSYRWGAPLDLKLAAHKLEQIPAQLGPWELESSEQLDEEVARVLESVGSVVRTYVNTQSGDRLTMFVLLGPPGPTAAHTPDICYSSRAYRTVRSEQRWEFSDGVQPHAFFGQTLESVDLEEGLLQVYHGWSPGDVWVAPDDARFAFGARRYLYKVQLAVPLLQLEDAQTDNDPGRDFLKHFVPAAQPLLMPPSTE